MRRTAARVTKMSTVSALIIAVLASACITGLRGDDFLAFTRTDVATGARQNLASYKMDGMTAMFIGAIALVSW